VVSISIKPPRQRVLQARLSVAQDVLVGVGLVAGIVISGLSLWAIIAKYRAAAVQRRHAAVQPRQGPR